MTDQELEAKKFLKRTTADEGIRAIHLDFNTPPAWGGLLEIRLSNGNFTVEDVIDVAEIERIGLPLTDSPKLRKLALIVFRKRFLPERYP